MKQTIIAFLLLASLTACKQQSSYNEAQKFMLKERDTEFDQKQTAKMKEPAVLVTPTDHMLLLGENGKFVLYCISKDSCVKNKDIAVDEVYGTIQSSMALLRQHTMDAQAAAQKAAVTPDGKPAQTKVPQNAQKTR